MQPFSKPSGSLVGFAVVETHTLDIPRPLSGVLLYWSSAFCIFFGAGAYVNMLPLARPELNMRTSLLRVPLCLQSPRYSPLSVASGWSPCRRGSCWSAGFSINTKDQSGCVTFSTTSGNSFAQYCRSIKCSTLQIALGLHCLVQRTGFSSALSVPFGFRDKLLHGTPWVTLLHHNTSMCCPAMQHHLTRHHYNPIRWSTALLLLQTRKDPGLRP